MRDFDFDFNILTAFIRLGRAGPVGAGCPPYYYYYYLILQKINVYFKVERLYFRLPIRCLFFHNFDILILPEIAHPVQYAVYGDGFRVVVHREEDQIPSYVRYAVIGIIIPLPEPRGK